MGARLRRDRAVGYAVPTKSTSISVEDDDELFSIENNPVLQYGGTLQFSMPYLKASVIDAGLPEFINHLIPIVEANFETPVSNNTGTGLGTTGTLNPGAIWVGTTTRSVPKPSFRSTARAAPERALSRNCTSTSTTCFPTPSANRAWRWRLHATNETDRKLTMHRASTLIATLSLLASAGTALAHAQLESASPAVGSTVRKAPSQFALVHAKVGEVLQ